MPLYVLNKEVVNWVYIILKLNDTFCEGKTSLCVCYDVEEKVYLNANMYV